MCVCVCVNTKDHWILQTLKIIAQVILIFFTWHVLLLSPLFRWTQPPSLSAGVDCRQRLRRRCVCGSHHAASQQFTTQQNVFPQQGSRARLETAARLYQCKTERCFLLLFIFTPVVWRYKDKIMSSTGICTNVGKPLLFFLQMQSDLFLSRQRKPRNRQLRKPLVVQVKTSVVSRLKATQLLWTVVY